MFNRSFFQIWDAKTPCPWGQRANLPDSRACTRYHLCIYRPLAAAASRSAGGHFCAVTGAPGANLLGVLPLGRRLQGVFLRRALSPFQQTGALWAGPQRVLFLFLAVCQVPPGPGKDARPGCRKPLGWLSQPCPLYRIFRQMSTGKRKSPPLGTLPA